MFSPPPFCHLLTKLEVKSVFLRYLSFMQRSSIGKFQRYCYVQYEGMFNTIEQVVFIEQ